MAQPDESQRLPAAWTSEQYDRIRLARPSPDAVEGICAALGILGFQVGDRVQVVERDGRRVLERWVAGERPGAQVVRLGAYLDLREVSPDPPEPAA